MKTSEYTPEICYTVETGHVVYDLPEKQPALPLEETYKYKIVRNPGYRYSLEENKPLTHGT